MISLFCFFFGWGWGGHEEGKEMGGYISFLKKRREDLSPSLVLV